MRKYALYGEILAWVTGHVNDVLDFRVGNADLRSGGIKLL